MAERGEKPQPFEPDVVSTIVGKHSDRLSTKRLILMERPLFFESGEVWKC